MNHAPSCRTALRVTKYDPTLRVGGRGGFTGDDWTSVSDVGGTFGGEVLTLHRYVEVEARYLQVVAAFLDEADVDFTIVRGAESYDARRWPEEGERLSRLETVDAVRELLRERGFCRLEAERDVYIHVGYDYYLYIGGEVDCEQTLNVAARAGLFVETDFTSPYHLNPETDRYF